MLNIKSFIFRNYELKKIKCVFEFIFIFILIKINQTMKKVSV